MSRRVLSLRSAALMRFSPIREGAPVDRDIWVRNDPERVQ